jgi:hypothetical protein
LNRIPRNAEECHIAENAIYYALANKELQNSAKEAHTSTAASHVLSLAGELTDAKADIYLIIH